MKKAKQSMMVMGLVLLSVAACKSSDAEDLDAGWPLEQDACLREGCEQDASREQDAGQDDLSGERDQQRQDLGPPVEMGPAWQVPEGMIEIQETTFLIGTPYEINSSGIFLGEAPVHEVTLSLYAIDRTEVTVAAYQACVEAGECAPPRASYEQDELCNDGAPGREQHPINCVDWVQARAFCQAQGLALPTEAQWELAARGPESRLYPWGEEPEPSCQTSILWGGLREDEEVRGKGCGRETTWPVGSRLQGASFYGVLDLVGNVSEWVYDQADTYYYTEEAKRDPQGPSHADWHHQSYRGSNWDRPGAYSSKRRGLDKDRFFPFLGFRCAKNSIEPPR